MGQELLLKKVLEEFMDTHVLVEELDDSERSYIRRSAFLQMAACFIILVFVFTVIFTAWLTYDANLGTCDIPMSHHRV